MDERELFEVKIICDFSAAHLLRNFRGKCEHLHGHNWKVEVIVRGNRLSESDILVDFGELKQAAREVIGELDHSFLNDLPAFKEVNPSSENIARYIYWKLSERFKNYDFWIHSVSAWESSNSCATYYGKMRELTATG
ncbi:MAG: 6-carboxytetrahydropterin synthase QueD [Syntrophobacterales bacterium]|nr:6-carboxytetrahydropterin synthase QueD [Syntrophobacterales bacterium]